MRSSSSGSSRCSRRIASARSGATSSTVRYASAVSGVSRNGGTVLVTISRSKPAFSHHALGIAREQAVGDGGVSRNRAPRLAGGRRASQGRAGADQVVDDHRHASLHRAHEQVLTAHHAAAPPFLHEGQRHVGCERAGERFAQQLRTLGPARVWRDDDHAPARAAAAAGGRRTAGAPRGGRSGTERRSRTPRGCARRPPPRGRPRPPRSAGRHSAS